MQNKRYKRLAKRIKGECIKRNYDDTCIEFNTCLYSKFCKKMIIPSEKNIPLLLSTKELEEIVKNNNKNLLFMD